MSKDKLKPRLPGGFRDYSTEDYADRKWVLDTVAGLYSKHGFKQLDTSSVEYFETLAGGDETSKQIYRIFNQTPDLSGESLALRFDLTVSLARFIASNRKAFTFPFKRYQMGEVWRGERQQKGRFKQFLQFDADIVGTKSPLADAEIILLIYESMKALKIDSFTIKLNNRKILNGFIQSIGLNENDINPFLRILDKLDKIGWEGVCTLLSAPRSLSESDSDDIEGLGLDITALNKVGELINLPEGNNNRLEKLKRTVDKWQIGMEGIEEIETILQTSIAAGVPELNIDFDPSIARGLDYYTGPVFETVLDDLPDIGSVMSGGRYDTLVERFSNETIPATGISLGVDRLLVGLKELSVISGIDCVSNILIVSLDNESIIESFNVATELRAMDIITEVYLGDNRSLKKQMTYANRHKIPYCIIIGEEERGSGTLKLKNMTTSEQVDFKRSELPKLLRKISENGNYN